MRYRSIVLSPQRRFVGDLLRAARGIPTVPVQRRMNLAPLADARAACPSRPGWTALFLLAYARVAQAVPPLRRAYVTFPTARLVEYPVSLANLAVERDYRGETGVFVGRIKDPASMTVGEVHERVRAFQTVPVEECGDFRRNLALARLPWPLRRLAWYVALNVPRQRGNYVGTFGVSVYSALGAESLHPISPCTTTLTYGVMDAGGAVDVRIVYDHRVLDGATVARALEMLEAELNGGVARELAAGPARLRAA